MQLFFVISGFILALPFAKYHLNNGQPVNVKNYLIRRLTRLEPPYIIIMTTLLLAHLFLVKSLSFNQGILSYLASVTYTHNIFYGHVLPFLNSVAWSLEIEVQFYLCMPFLSLIFKIHNALNRRLLMVFLIILFVCTGERIPINITTLINYLEYFLTGLLLADMYLSRSNQDKVSGSIKLSLLTTICFISIWAFNAKKIPAGLYLTLWEIMQICLLFSFYYLILIKKSWTFLSRPAITNIGGMCYTIYLIHYPIISIIGNVIVKHQFSAVSFINTSFYIITLLLSISVSSVIFFLIIERPCMDKHWPQKLYLTLKKLFVH